MSALAKLLVEDERVLREGGVSRAYGSWFTVAILTVGIGLSVLVVAGLRAYDRFMGGVAGAFGGPAPTLASTVGAILVVVMPLTLIFLLLRAWFTILYTAYLLTDRRLITRYGLLARRVSQADLTRIQDVHVRQTLMGRLLGYGDVLIETAGQGSLRLLYVSRPDDWSRDLYSLSRSGSTTGRSSLLDAC